jgi:hypothetical protein
MNRFVIVVDPGMSNDVQLPPGNVEVPGDGIRHIARGPEVYCSNRTNCAFSLKYVGAAEAASGSNPNSSANVAKLRLIIFTLRRQHKNTKLSLGGEPATSTSSMRDRYPITRREAA